MSSVSRLRVLGFVVTSAWLAVGCNGLKKIEVGATCLLNSDCNQPLVCTMSKCHEGCRSTVDCPVGEICTRVGDIGVCQLPDEAKCVANVRCGPLLICAADLRCRSSCNTPVDCMGGQVCVQNVCAESAELDVTGQLPQKAAPAIPDAGTYDASSPDVPLDLSGDLPLATPDAGVPSGGAGGGAGAGGTGGSRSTYGGGGNTGGGGGGMTGLDAMPTIDARLIDARLIDAQLDSSLCGDHKIDTGEQCDDGNTISGDGCSSTCQIEPGYSCPIVGQQCINSLCGNGFLDLGEQCDAGDKNGVFYGDGTGCSKTCTKEPICRDSAGHNQACTTSCGDGNRDEGEECDDGNQVSGDGCSKDCKKEAGFSCTDNLQLDSSTCKSGTGTCLELPVIYRDFQPENVSPGGHPDFYWLGAKTNGSSAPTTICVPNSGGPARGYDSTARCWDIPDPNLLNGKPVYNSKRVNNQCACQFSDYNIGNSARIPGLYTQAANDSPLSDGAGDYRGGAIGSTVTLTNESGSVAGTISGYTPTIPGGPIFNGVVPIVKDGTSFKQWFTDDSSVNQTFTSVLEMPAIGTNVYQYASTSHLAQGGFYPLDTLNPSQATLCNLWPYWNHGNGMPIWTTCQGEQYFFPPRIVAGDCGAGKAITDGCWVTAVPGVKHDNYFTTEARYFFVYDTTAGFALQFFGDDDLFVFINGILVLDLGGIHQEIPGKVVVTGGPGPTQATITEGGCLDANGNITTTQAGYLAAGCASKSATNLPAPISPDDFRIRTANLSMNNGQVYEVAIFGADRHPPESNFRLTLNGSTSKRSICQRN